MKTPLPSLPRLGFADEPLPCHGVSPRLFFLDDHPSPPQIALRTRQVAEVCGSCRFREACRQSAEERGEIGSWGGVLFVEGRRRKDVIEQQEQGAAA